MMALFSIMLDKKLLLLLFISLGLIGSANADSIKGAFGYKLGQVVKGIKIEEDRDGFKQRYDTFKPAKPIPGFNTYFVHTTLKTNKVFEISAHSRMKIDIDKYYSCAGVKAFSNLLYALENNYGSFGNSWDDGGWTTYTKNRGDRRIRLQCVFWTGSNEVSIYLEYFDNELAKLLREENNQYSDYDL